MTLQRRRGDRIGLAQVRAKLDELVPLRRRRRGRRVGALVLNAESSSVLAGAVGAQHKRRSTGQGLQGAVAALGDVSATAYGEVLSGVDPTVVEVGLLDAARQREPSSTPPTAAAAPSTSVGATTCGVTPTSQFRGHYWVVSSGVLTRYGMRRTQPRSLAGQLG